LRSEALPRFVDQPCFSLVQRKVELKHVHARSPKMPNCRPVVLRRQERDVLIAGSLRAFATRSI
jgi:hypothetical protein